MQKVLLGLALPVRKFSAFLASLAGMVRAGKCGCRRQGKKITAPAAGLGNQSPSPFSLAGRSPSTNHAHMHASGLANRSLGSLMRASARKRTKRPQTDRQSSVAPSYLADKPFTDDSANAIVLLCVWRHLLMSHSKI